MELLDHIATLWHFEKWLNCFPKWLHHFTFPIGSIWLWIAFIFTKIWAVWSFYFSHSCAFIAVFHWLMILSTYSCIYAIPISSFVKSQFKYFAYCFLRGGKQSLFHQQMNLCHLRFSNETDYKKTYLPSDFLNCKIKKKRDCGHTHIYIHT